MRYFTLTHQNRYGEAGYGRVRDDGTCEVVLKPGYCPLEKANTIQTYPSLADVLDIDVIMGFQWTGLAPFNPEIDCPKAPKGIFPVKSSVPHWIFNEEDE